MHTARDQRCCSGHAALDQRRCRKRSVSANAQYERESSVDAGAGRHAPPSTRPMTTWTAPPTSRSARAQERDLVQGAAMPVIDGIRTPYVGCVLMSAPTQDGAQRGARTSGARLPRSRRSSHTYETEPSDWPVGARLRARRAHTQKVALPDYRQTRNKKRRCLTDNRAVHRAQHDRAQREGGAVRVGPPPTSIKTSAASRSRRSTRRTRSTGVSPWPLLRPWQVSLWPLPSKALRQTTHARFLCRLTGFSPCNDIGKIKGNARVCSCSAALGGETRPLQPRGRRTNRHFAARAAPALVLG